MRHRRGWWLVGLAILAPLGACTKSLEIDPMGPSGGTPYCEVLYGRAVGAANSTCSSGPCAETPYESGTPVELRVMVQPDASVSALTLIVGGETYRGASDSANRTDLYDLSYLVAPRPRSITQGLTNPRVHINWNHFPDGPGQPRTSVAWPEGSIIVVTQRSGATEIETLRAYVDRPGGCTSV